MERKEVMNECKSLIRIAIKIQEALVKLRTVRLVELQHRFANLAGQVQEFNTESRKLGKALSHNLNAAAKRVRTRIGRLICDLSYTVQRNKQLIDVPDTGIPKLAVLVADLKQLEEDCGQVDYDRDKNSVSIITDPIELEGINLGPFKIMLELSRLSELYKDSPYYCIALEPNPAGSCSDVTHPHVSGEHLCEGDGSVAIRAALEQGRLCDFFTMVISILNTYNPDSPYVSVSEWDGSPCYDCGYTMNSDDVYFCPFCDHDYCDDCSTYCQICDETTCLGCGGECPVCGQMCCSDCVTQCAECEELCCKDCLNEDLCPNCTNESEVENEQEGSQENKNQSQPEQPEVRAAGQEENSKSVEATVPAV